MATTLTGGCQCGAVRFRVSSAPTDTYVCHCRMCQKSVGGPFEAFAVVPAAGFAWTRGRPAEWASSSLGVRQFCGACGTPLGYRYLEGQGPTDQFLTSGSFDDTAAVAPAIEVGIESRVAWLGHMEGLPQRATTADLEARVVNYQHPDHETEAWTPRPPED